MLYFWHYAGNRFLTLLSNMFTNLNLTDLETCYKLVRMDLLKRLPLTSNRFGFEVEITARLAQAGARIWEMPISYSGRTYEEGKKITWRDGVAALFHILRYNSSSLATQRLALAEEVKRRVVNGGRDPGRRDHRPQSGTRRRLYDDGLYAVSPPRSRLGLDVHPNLPGTLAAVHTRRCIRSCSRHSLACCP